MMATRDAISPDLLAPRLPALGYIKIGGKKPAITSKQGNTFQPPEKYDHFKIRTRSRGADGNFELDAAVHAIVGAEPKELLVRLPFDHRAQNFYAQMTQYVGRTRVRECNGDTCLVASTQVTEVCARRQGKVCTCKPYGRLAVILEDAPTFGGLYVFRTTSWESVNSLQTALRMFEQQFGSLQGLPLKLVVYPAEVQFKDKDGTDKTGTAYKVALVLRANFQEAQQATLEYHRSNQLARREILQLASGTAAGLDELDRADAPEIEAEYFPPLLPAGKPSKLAEINAQILGATTAEPAAPTDPPAPTIDDLVAETRRLLNGVKHTLTTDAVRRIEAAITGRDPDTLGAARDWLQGLREKMDSKEAS